MGFPKGASIPFGHLRGEYPAGEMPRLCLGASWNSLELYLVPLGATRWTCCFPLQRRQATSSPDKQLLLTAAIGLSELAVKRIKQRRYRKHSNPPRRVYLRSLRGVKVIS